MFHSIGKKHKKGIRKAGILLFWLLIWYVLAQLVDNSILLVTPWEVLARLCELVLEVSFWQAIGISWLRIGIGFVAGLSVALFLAGISLRYSLAEEVLQPVMSLMKTVPVASFVVLFLIWWGSSVLAVAICFLVVVPNIYINTLEGLKAADKQLLEMATVFRMNVRNRFFFIYRPALRPFLVSGMKLSLGMCWKSGVAAEVIGTPLHSIGGELYLSKIYLDTAGVLAWTAIIVVLSLGFEKIVLWLTERFFEWVPSVENKKNALSEEKSTEAVGYEKKCLQVKRVSKSYGSQQIFSKMSVSYEQNQIYCLMNPSGSGKTTLLKLLCGLEKPDEGRIEGVDRFSMVFQEDRLCEEYTAVQNVAMVIGDKERATEALQKLLEKEALQKPCSQLSGGMRRRVALVRAMEAESDAVLLDEPFTGMDVGTRQSAEAYIRAKQNGRIVIIATHI